MDRPSPKNYYPRDFINGTYEDDLEKYIDFLEKNIIKMKNIRIIKTKGGFIQGHDYMCHENTAQMLINGGFGVEVSEIKEKEHAKPKNKISPEIEQPKD